MGQYCLRSRLVSMFPRRAQNNNHCTAHRVDQVVEGEQRDRVRRLSCVNNRFHSAVVKIARVACAPYSGACQHDCSHLKGNHRLTVIATDGRQYSPNTQDTGCTLTHIVRAPVCYLRGSRRGSPGGGSAASRHTGPCVGVTAWSTICINM
jgi:hypothetical protein